MIAAEAEDYRQNRDVRGSGKGYWDASTAIDEQRALARVQSFAGIPRTREIRARSRPSLVGAVPLVKIVKVMHTRQDIVQCVAAGQCGVELVGNQAIPRGKGYCVAVSETAGCRSEERRVGKECRSRVGKEYGKE